jgi:hypothetical protein
LVGREAAHLVATCLYHRREWSTVVCGTVIAFGKRRSHIVRSHGTVERSSTSLSTSTHTVVTRNNSAEHLLVQKDIKLTSTRRSKLTKNNVLGNTTAVVKLTRGGGFEQNLDCLFERTTHECTSVSTVYTVTSDSHEVTASSHDIDQKGQMAMVDIRTIEWKHLLQFSHQGGSSSLNTEHTEDVDEVVGVGTSRVSAFNSKDFLESSSTSIQEPFLAKRIALGHGETTIFLDA